MKEKKKYVFSCIFQWLEEMKKIIIIKIVQNGFGLLPNCIVTRAAIRLGIVLQYEVYCKRKKKKLYCNRKAGCLRKCIAINGIVLQEGRQ